MKAISLQKVLKGKSGWVSISQDYKKVIAEGSTLQDLLKKLNKMGNPEGFITNVAEDYSKYVG